MCASLCVCVMRMEWSGYSRSDHDETWMVENLVLDVDTLVNVSHVFCGETT